MTNLSVRTSFSIPAGMKIALKARAEAEGVSLGELVRRAATPEALSLLRLPR